MKKISKKTLGEVKKMQDDVFYFLEKVLNKTIQPIKPHCSKTKIENFKVEHFGDKKIVDGIEEYMWYDFDPKKHITWQQAKALDLVNKGGRVAIGSGRGTGKTYLQALICIHSMLKGIDTKGIVTAPTQDHLYTILWSEIKKILENEVKEKAPEIYHSLIHQDKFLRNVERPKTWFLVARTAKDGKAQSVAGLHNESGFTLILADEASDVPTKTLTTLSSGLTDAVDKDYLFFLGGNTIHPTGYFRDAFKKDSPFKSLQFNSLETPLRKNSDWIKEIINSHGIDSLEYKGHVLGEFPPDDIADEDGYIPLFFKREIVYADDDILTGEMVLGIDPAGEGRDTTTFVIRDATKAKIVAIEAKSTPESITKRAVMLCDFYGITKVAVDSFGVGGDSVQLMERQGLKVRAVSVGKKTEDKKYANLKAKLYFRLKRWIKQRGELVRNNEWENKHEALKYTNSEKVRGTYKMLSKEDMKKKGLRSPDEWEALMVTFVFKINKKTDINEKSLTSRGLRRYCYNNNEDKTDDRGMPAYIKNILRK